MQAVSLLVELIYRLLTVPAVSCFARALISFLVVFGVN